MEREHPSLVDELEAATQALAAADLPFGRAGSTVDGLLANHRFLTCDRSRLWGIWSARLGQDPPPGSFPNQLHHFQC